MFTSFDSLAVVVWTIEFESELEAQPTCRRTPEIREKKKINEGETNLRSTN